jgi:hypothetical protein
MGVHGYGHDQMLILLQDEGVKYRPDIVLLGFIGLDMTRNLLDFRDYAKPRFVLERDRLVRVGVPVPPPDAVLRWDWIRPRIVDVMAIGWHRFEQATGRHTRRARTITARLLEELVRTSASVGAEAVLVYVPDTSQIATPVATAPEEAFLLEFLAQHPRTRGFSSSPAFERALGEGAQLRHSGHWGPTGHQIIAQAIADYLRAEGLVAPVTHAAR